MKTPFLIKKSGFFLGKHNADESLIYKSQSYTTIPYFGICSRSMKKAIENLNLMVDNGGRRSRIDRRIFSYGVVLPDRRSGTDRRSGIDRRISPQLKLSEELERRQAFKF
jgi:hypothetical protein